MRFVFLDIDGVLNDLDYICYRRDLELSQSLYARYQAGEGSLFRLKAKALDIDDVRVGILNEILKPFEDIYIVLSSTWRILSTCEDVTWMLRHRGFKGKIEDRTDNEYLEGVWPTRGQRIQHWLSQSELPITSYLILEDEVDPYMPPDRVVKTSYSKGGLSELHVETAQNILATELTDNERRHLTSVSGKGIPS